MESLFVYPMITLVEGAVISMSLSNLTQNCGDSYTIILYDPTNTTLLHSVTDSAFSYASNVNGSNLVLISYTTALATIKSNKYHVDIGGSLKNLTVAALFSMDSLAASSTNVSLSIYNGTFGACGILLPGDQSFALSLNVQTGLLESYTVTLVGAVSFTKFINTTGLGSTAVQVTLPPLGMGASCNLAIVAKSSLGEQIVIAVPVRGVATLRTTIESLLSYPQLPISKNQIFNISANNLTQNCGDNYTIQLRDPTDTISIASAGSPPTWIGALNVSGTYRIQLTVSFTKFINTTGLGSTAVQVTLPPLGMGASCNLAIVAKSSLGEQIVTAVPVRGVATLRTTIESLLSYPQLPISKNQMFNISANNLTQNCGDNYTIQLRDPTDTISIASTGSPPTWIGALNVSGTYRIQLTYSSGLPDIVYSQLKTVNVIGELKNLSVTASFTTDSFLNETASFALELANGNSAGQCGALLPGDQSVSLILAVGDGVVVSYNVNMGSFSQFINTTDSTNYTVQVTLPLIGVRTRMSLTVVVKSKYNETLSTVVNVTGIVSKRSTIESLFIYPTATVMAGSLINMSVTNLTQNCDDSYAITLNDPLNNTLIYRANNTAFSYASNYDGKNLVLLSYTTSLTTIFSDKFFVTVGSKLSNLTITALFGIDALSAGSVNTSRLLSNTTSGSCGVQIPGDQDTTLSLGVATGAVANYTLTLTGGCSYSKVVSAAGNNGTVQLTLPAIGVRSSCTMTIVATSIIGEILSTQLQVRGVITTRAALKTLFNYPIVATSIIGEILSTQLQVRGVITTRAALKTLFNYPSPTPVVTRAIFAMNFTNLTQGCDGYSITLRNPANTVNLSVAINSSFAGSSNISGPHPVVLQYTSDLGTVYSDDLTVLVAGKLENLIASATFNFDVNTPRSVSIVNGSDSGVCGVLLPGDQNFTLDLAVGDGALVSYDVSIGSFSQFINLTGLGNFTVSVSVPAIGVQTKTTLTITAKSMYNEVLSTKVSVTAVATLRSTVESMLTYPKVPLVAGNTIDMRVSNLSQNCGDFYTITLKDPTNTNVISTANNTNFNAISNVDGKHFIILDYTSPLGTITSNQFFVLIAGPMSDLTGTVTVTYDGSQTTTTNIGNYTGCGMQVEANQNFSISLNVGAGAVGKYDITFGTFSQSIDCRNTTDFARSITLSAIGYGERVTLTILATSIYNETLSLVTPVTGVANRAYLEMDLTSPTGLLLDDSSPVTVRYHNATVCNETTKIVLSNPGGTVLESSTTGVLTRSLPGPGIYPVSVTLTTNIGFITINRTITVVGKLANLTVTGLFNIDSLASGSTPASKTIANNSAGSCGVLLPGDQNTTLLLDAS
uniref:Uncharacterized protein n=1 Tax=Plectus sambesii TaxID=2011161 RepID=A0A914XRM8_9BILA